tara:strand:+ start:557 stop:1303 length:747 start_codon:yes stop_codon:yes gene_type:complete
MRTHTKISVANVIKIGRYCGSHAKEKHSPDASLGQDLTSLGCLDHNEIGGYMWMPSKKSLLYLARQLKGIVLYRQPDDWIYSSFNFWCVPGFDVDCPHEKWLTMTQKRSAKIFHEYLTSAACNDLYSLECGLRKPNYVATYCNLGRILTRENIIVVSTEELYYAGYKVMSEVFTKLGLLPYGNLTMFEEAYNVNGKKGPKQLSAHSDGLGKTLQPMLAESRWILREKIGFDGLRERLSNITGNQFRWE